MRLIMEVVLRIAMDDKECSDFQQVLEPDNNNTVRMQCDDHGMTITISELKTTSLYSLVDDILRSYEVFKKI